MVSVLDVGPSINPIQENTLLQNRGWMQHDPFDCFSGTTLFFHDLYAFWKGKEWYQQWHNPEKIGIGWLIPMDPSTSYKKIQIASKLYQFVHSEQQLLGSILYQKACDSSGGEFPYMFRRFLLRLLGGKVAYSAGEFEDMYLLGVAPCPGCWLVTTRIILFLQ